MADADPAKPPTRAWLLPALIAGTIAVVTFLVEGRRGFGFADEGFLWYGVQRVLAGEVPLRDFQSYDVGRYYWSAALLAAMGSHGVVALRAAALVFEALCMFAGLATLARFAPRAPGLLWLLAGGALAAWMSPLYRIFDIAVAILPVAAFALVLERPTPRRFLASGVVVGAMAVLGRNHGLYAAVAGLGVIAYVALAMRDRRSAVRGLGAWALGVVLGFGPMPLMFLAVPGFWAAFAESMRLIGEAKTTNLAIPVPFPWRYDLSGLRPFWILERVLMGCSFIGIVAFGALGIPWAAWRARGPAPLPPMVVAAAIVSLPYVHIAYSRAELVHLTTSMIPVLLGTFALIAAWEHQGRLVAAALASGLAVLIAAPLHSYWPIRSAPWVETAVGPDRLMLDPNSARTGVMIGQAVAKFAPHGEGLVAIPAIPGVYAMSGRKAPMWEVYAIFPRTEAFQRAELARLDAARPPVLILYDFPVDGREDLRYGQTHALLDQYVRQHYVPMAGVQAIFPYKPYRRVGLAP